MVSAYVNEMPALAKVRDIRVTVASCGREAAAQSRSNDDA